MKNNHTPEIRFPGFTGDWEQRKLGDLVIDVSRPIKMVDDDNYQLVTVKRRNGGIVSRGIYKGSEVLVKSQFTIKTGDYLISKRQVVHGANGIVPESLDGSIVSNEYLVLQGNKDLNIKFFSLISELPSMYKNYFLSSYGIDIEKLVFNVPDWKKRKISIPSIPEQNQITSFIKVMNNVITLHQQELTTLKQTKQGFLQKMFPKEGEFVPEVRFDGFSGEWSKVTLDNVIQKQIKGKAQLDKLSDGEVEYLDASRLNGGEPFYSNGIQDVFPNNILILWDGSKAGTVYKGFRGVLGSTLKAYSINEKNNSDFIYQQLVRNQEKIYKDYRTPNIPHVIKDFTDVFMLYITSLEEQQKIGDFFKQLDDIIALHQRELDILKETKKAFLQKMFV